MMTYFYLWERRRENLIDRHNFYVNEGRLRLTNQFSDMNKIEKEADEFASQWLKKIERHLDPAIHEITDFHEQAREERFEFFNSLNELGNLARLSLISGMFHLWERSVREWLTSRDGILSWHTGEALPRAIWKSNFSQLFELFSNAGFFHEGDNVKDRLNVVRLVVNTYKHGRGDSLNSLKEKRPEFFGLSDSDAESCINVDYKIADHNDLYVNDDNIEEFSKCIVDFWYALPEYITDQNLRTVPRWFDDAYQMDIKGKD